MELTKKQVYHKNYHKEWYKKNLLFRQKQIKERKAVLKDWMFSYKLHHPCYCGESHPAALDFHHLGHVDKILNVADMLKDGWSIDSMLKEISKCEILCSNCHRKKHYEKLNTGK